MSTTTAPPPGKSPLVAVLASLFLYFIPGAGQLYAGRDRRGLCFLFGTYAGTFALLYVQVTFLPGGARWLMGALLVAWWGFLAFDAYRCALASPPTLEDAALARLPAEPDGLPSLPSFEPASPALRWTWAATRWLTMSCGALLALGVVASGTVAAMMSLKTASPLSAVFPLLIAGTGAALLWWLGGRARRVYAAAAGLALLPADSLKSEVSSFAKQGALLGVIFLFGVFVTQGIWRDLYRKADEGATRGGLLRLREAIGKARADESGLPPAALAELAPRYIKEIPATKLRVSAFSRHHRDSAAVRAGSKPTDEGGWLYDAEAGAVSVNCTHTDYRGKAWNGY